jgi:hypothetical protein
MRAQGIDKYLNLKANSIFVTLLVCSAGANAYFAVKEIEKKQNSDLKKITFLEFTLMSIP